MSGTKMPHNTIYIEPKLVATTSKGCSVWCRHNEAGGLTYTSNEVGGGILVWNTALVDREVLALALAHNMSTNGTLAPEERLPEEYAELLSSCHAILHGQGYAGLVRRLANMAQKLQAPPNTRRAQL